MSQPTRIPRRRKTNGSSQFLFSALILVGVIASLVGMYFFMEEQKSLNEKQLATLEEKVEVNMDTEGFEGCVSNNPKAKSILGQLIKRSKFCCEQSFCITYSYL